MEQLQLLIGRLLLAGVLLSLLLVMAGGSIYLFQHGNEVVNFNVFQGEPTTFSSIQGLWQDMLSFSARGIIELGLLTLVLLQVLRIILTAWIFVKLRDRRFVVISLFVLAVLLYSLFWA